MAARKKVQHESLWQLANTCDRRQEEEATKMLPLSSGSTPLFIAAHETPRDSVAGWLAAVVLPSGNAPPLAGLLPPKRMPASRGLRLRENGQQRTVSHLFVSRIHKYSNSTRGVFCAARERGGHWREEPVRNYLSLSVRLRTALPTVESIS